MTSATGVARTTSESFPILYVNDTKSSGGFNAKATQNMPFEIISPQVHNITVPGTTVSAQMRTVTNSNLADGSGEDDHVPFASKGWETITLNKTNYLDTPRAIASRINETSNSVISDQAGDRSFNMRLNLSSSDTRLSPIIDTQRMNVILTSNRIDSPIIEYASDSRVNGLFTDPTACQYVSKEQVLANGATSIKILLNAHVNPYSDIRAFYAISDHTGFNPQFIPFPGYYNINDRGEVILASKSDGRTDDFIPPNDPKGFESSELDFTEANWTANNLPKFTAYRIKILLAGTTQAYPPRINNLRVLTLA